MSLAKEVPQGFAGTRESEPSKLGCSRELPTVYSWQGGADVSVPVRCKPRLVAGMTGLGKTK